MINELIQKIKHMAAEGKTKIYSPPELKDLEFFEETFKLNLPETYKSFILNCGALSSMVLQIFGLGPDVPLKISLQSVLLGLRIIFSSLPREMVPLEDFGGGQLACLDCKHTGYESYRVILIKSNSDSSEYSISPLAESFEEYLSNRVRYIENCIAKSDVWSHLSWHVNQFHKKYEYSHETGGKLPKNYEWRPYRYCVQDVVLGTIVLRHNREWNLLEVDVYMTADHVDFPAYHGDRGLAVFALTEAFHCGGTMDIQFTENVNGGRVPSSLVKCANSLGVNLVEGINGRIKPGEARDLYLAITPFSEDFREHMKELEKSNIIRPERACYLIHHGVWSPSELESIVRSSALPERILSGSVSPLIRHLFLEDLQEARAALLGGFLDRKLAHKDQNIDLEDDVRLLNISFDSEYYGKVYQCHEEIPLTWIHENKDDTLSLKIEPNKTFRVLIRARDVGDICLSWGEDIQASKDFAQEKQALLLYAHDFLMVDSNIRENIYNKAKQYGVQLLICPETTQSLDAQALQRLERSRITRQ